MLERTSIGIDTSLSAAKRSRYGVIAWSQSDNTLDRATSLVDKSPLVEK